MNDDTSPPILIGIESNDNILFYFISTLKHFFFFDILINCYIQLQ